MNDEIAKQEDMQTRSLSGIVFLSGIWLTISPFIFSYSASGMKWDQFAFGIAIALLAIIRYFATSALWSSWLSALFGLWMIVAPFVVNGASTAVYWSSIIGGLVALILSLAATASYTPSHHLSHHRGHPAM